MMSNEKKTLGIEFGSTRIKTCVIDGTYHVLSSGDHTWKSDCVNGVWTYDLKDAWDGLRDALRHTECLDGLDAMGVSAMMHGYLAFDKDWNLLAPFRTWQNTMTGQAAGELTGLFRFNIPQRWSVLQGKTFWAWGRPAACSPSTRPRWTTTTAWCRPLTPWKR